MRKSDNGQSIHRFVKDAIDEDALAAILEHASDAECNQEAVDALHEVLADEIIDLAFGASRFARRRGRLPTGDDIVDVKERQCECFPQTHMMMALMDPEHAKIESV